MTQIHNTRGHLLAFFTILVWGTTFISTKILLNDFTPVEILFIRFAMGTLFLILLYPHRFKPEKRSHEVYFILAGFTGILLYYLLENIALTMTTAGNVGILVAVAPFFTAILSRLFFKTEKVGKTFYLGFIVAIIGIAIISYNGSTNIEINPLGDILSILAAIMWAFYSNITKKISSFGYNTIQTTRRSFFYGLVLMIPFLFIMDANLSLGSLIRITEPMNLANLIFLGLGASAVCFVTWGLAIKYIGAIKTSVYIYLGPVITVITSAIVLKERITFLLIIGITFIIIGLLLSESKTHKRNKNQ